MTFVDDLGDLVEAIEAEGVQASADSSELNLPAVFVTLDRLTDGNLGGTYTTRARILLLVPDQDSARAAAALAELFAKVGGIVPPHSDVEAQAARLPDGSEVPALSYTHDV